MEFFQQETWYHDTCYKYGDPRSTNFFMLETPVIMFSVLGVYLISVVVLGRFMEGRKALDLRAHIFVYNTALVGLSGYMFIEFLTVAVQLEYSFTCEPVDWEYKTDALSLRMVNVSWLFFCSKIIELVDTIFFILRKKNSQVTFLHVYHHATMVMNWWMAAKYVPSGQSFFIGVVNSLIHTLMYAYYALACMGPRVQKLLWWKKYMTSLQLVQFVLVVTHTGNALYISSCDYPYLYGFITFYYAWSMMFLFLNFYYHTYISANKTPPKTTHPIANGGSRGQINGDSIGNGDCRAKDHGDSAYKGQNDFEAKANGGFKAMGNGGSGVMPNGDSVNDSRGYANGNLHHRRLNNGRSEEG